MSQVKVVRIRYETDNKALKDDKKLVESIAKEFGVAEDHVEALNDELKQTGEGVKKVDKSFNRVGDSLKKVGALFGVAFGVAAIKSAVSALHEHALALEAVEKKANTVFGNYAKQVQDFAKVNAASFGLTEQEVIRSAAAVGDLLVPMGFAREEAANMSTDLVGLSGALSEWSGGMVSSTEVANILAKAMLGEREQLKTLGISISEADVQTRLLEKGQKKLTGTALQQAKALATQELIFEKSTDAQAAFANNQDSLTRQTAELNSVLATIKDTIALALIPAFKSATTVANDVLQAIFGTKSESEKLTEEWEKQSKSVNDLDAELTPLVNRYDELQSKGELNVEEQAELDGIIKTVAASVPLAVTEFNKYGEALALNTGAVRENIEAQQRIAELTNREAIAATKDEIRRLSGEVQNATTILQAGGVEIAKYSKTGARIGTEFIANTEPDILRFQQTIRDGNTRLGELALQLGGLGVEFSEAERGFINASVGFDVFKSSVDEVIGGEGGGTGSGGVSGLKKEIKPLAGSIAFLREKVSTLQGELEKIPKDFVEINDKGQKVTKTTAEYTAKLEELTTASFNLQRALGEIEPLDVERVIPQTVFKQADELPRRSSEAIKQYLEDTEETLKTGGEFWAKYGQQIQQTIFSSLGNITTFQDASLNRQIAALEANQERQLKATEGNEQAQQAVREKFEKQAGELRKKNAKKKVLIESAIAAVKAFADLGPIGGAIALVALGINTAAQLSLIDSQSFFKGGFTGKDGLGFGDKYGEFAGYVHKDEFVMPKDKTRQWRPLLEMMHEGKIKPWQLKNPQEMRVTVNQFDDGRIHKDLVRLYGAMNRTPNRPKGYA